MKLEVLTIGLQTLKWTCLILLMRSFGHPYFNTVLLGVHLRTTTERHVFEWNWTICSNLLPILDSKVNINWGEDRGRMLCAWSISNSLTVTFKNSYQFHAGSKFLYDWTWLLDSNSNQPNFRFYESKMYSIANKKKEPFSAGFGKKRSEPRCTWWFHFWVAVRATLE